MEGVLDRTITGLSQDQEVRRVENPEAAEQIDTFIQKIKQLKELSTDFTVVIEFLLGITSINVVFPVQITIMMIMDKYVFLNK